MQEQILNNSVLVLDSTPSKYRLVVYPFDPLFIFQVVLFCLFFKALFIFFLICFKIVLVLRFLFLFRMIFSLWGHHL